MAPSFTLKSLSPSRTSLHIPSPNTQSPLPSPQTSNASPTPSSQTSYFPSPNRPQPNQVSKDEAFKTVRALEEVLSAWNEYRISLGSMGKAGRKFATALKGLAGGMDKTEVPAQTMRPTAALLDGIADVTIKMAKKVDKEYEEANSDASKYFNLLAKESRSHEAYMGAIGKKHDKAEKAYRKASKTLSDNSSAHAGLLNLKDTLSADIAKAQCDHTSHIGSKQSTLLLHFASSTGSLSETLMSYFSEGLRKSGTAYRDIEYFRVLADIHWQGAVPNNLEEEDEGKRREELRLIKARIALGEMDMVGDKIWAGLLPGGAVSIPNATAGATKGLQPGDTGAIAPENTLKSTEKGPSGAATDSIPPSAVVPPQSAQHPAPRPSITQLPSNSSLASSKTSSSESANTKPILTTPSSGTIQRSMDRPDPHSSDPPRHVDTTVRPTQITHTRPQEPTYTSPPPNDQAHHMIHTDLRSITMHRSHPPAPKRTVSQIAAEMNAHASADREREIAFEAHKSHGSFARGCRLCDMDYDRMMQIHVQPSRPNPGSRRVTMPPVYNQAPPVQPERPSYRQMGYSYEDPYELVSPRMVQESARRVSYHEERDVGRERDDMGWRGLAAPRPQRAVRLSPEFEGSG